MRQWFGIDPWEMCTEHCKRELMEMKQVYRLVRGQWDVDDETIVSKLAGHAARGQIDTTLLDTRWRKLVAELERRGEPLPSNCPVEPPTYPEIVPHFTGRPENPREANVERLMMKCEKCATRMDR